GRCLPTSSCVLHAPAIRPPSPARTGAARKGLTLGIPLTDHALIVVLLRLHTVFVHVNVRLPDGFWDELVAMPNYHQRHHDRSGVVRNYASLFPWIDRLFGTHSHGRGTDFGVDDPLPGDFTGLLMSPLTRPVAASVRQP
ncbi:MAG: sterol desaturase family protein, partial [Myxococcales bacterium]|nr:sterol desaturase family protein [Myxococcales bacterium]